VNEISSFARNVPKHFVIPRNSTCIESFFRFIYPRHLEIEVVSVNSSIKHVKNRTRRSAGHVLAKPIPPTY